MGFVAARSFETTLRVTLHLRASLECRAVAIDLVSALIAHVPGADSTFRHEMVTAFGEAFNNIAMHGYRDRTDGTIEVEAEIRPGELILRLKDEGQFVDFAAIEAPDLESMPESGMGVYLIHATVDEVAYSRGRLNVLSLTKRTILTPPDHS